MAKEGCNTFFLFKDRLFSLLIDTGGGHEVLTQLNKRHMDVTSINNVFITHTHADHLFGFVYLIRNLVTVKQKSGTDHKLNVFCTIKTKKAAERLIRMDIGRDYDQINDNVSYIIINGKKNAHKKMVFDSLGVQLLFFNSKNKNKEQMCLKITDSNGLNIVYTGDVPCSKSNFCFVKDANYLIHEAYCLKSEAAKMKATKRSHHSVDVAAGIAKTNSVKNLILVHRSKTGNINYDKKIKLEAEKNSGKTCRVILPKDNEIVKIQ